MAQIPQPVARQLKNCAYQSAGTLSIVSSHIELVLRRVPAEDRATRDSLELVLAAIDSTQRELVRAYAGIGVITAEAGGAAQPEGT